MMEASAKQKEYDVEKDQQTMVIPRNDFKSMDLNFKEGKELEFVFTIEVKDNFPIDIWFVNEDNYLLLSGGAQFLFFIDGTDQKVSYAKKIVTLKEHDTYKLVLTNYYNNQSVQVDIKYEMRTYSGSSDENVNLYIILYTLLIVVVVLGSFLIMVVIRNSRPGRSRSKKIDGINSRHSKKKGSNNKNHKRRARTSAKKPKSKKIEKPKPKIEKNTKAEPKKSVVPEAGSFCGYCGAPSDTPFCKNCGKKI
jgi:hypothetical protein